MDDPDHARLRGVVEKFFMAPSVMKREDQVAGIVNDAVQKVIDTGQSSIDIEKEFAYTIPIDVVSLIMGLPREDMQLFHRWAPGLNESMIPNLSEERQEAAGQTVREVTAYLVERFRKGDLRYYGEDTVLSLLKDAVDSGVMTEDEMIPQAVQLYIGGHETTLQLIGLTLYQLLKNPAEMAKLKANPKLAMNAVNETIRVDGVSQIIGRRVAKDYTLHGVTMKADDSLFIGNGAANRDPSVYENPRQFDIERKLTKPHLGFGHGIRHCLGNHLARLETRLAVNAVLAAFPDIHLSEDHEPDYNHNMMMHGLVSLDVELH
jgi:cytochrome P450